MGFIHPPGGVGGLDDDADPASPLGQHRHRFPVEHLEGSSAVIRGSIAVNAVPLRSDNNGVLVSIVVFRRSGVFNVVPRLLNVIGARLFFRFRYGYSQG